MDLHFLALFLSRLVEGLFEIIEIVDSNQKLLKCIACNKIDNKIQGFNVENCDYKNGLVA